MELGAGDLPPGFRFHPTAEEIIIHYLLNKVIDESFVSIPIREVVDLNKCEPWDLPQKAKMGENEWYFFYQKDRKYARGRRSNRATKLGYWKATGKDREIYKKGAKSSCLVGMKKTLVFYKGRAPKGERSNWVMHEYRLEGNFSDYNFSNTAKEAWVVCRVFHKKTINGTSDDILPGVEVAKLESDHSPTVVLPQLTVDYSCFTERSPTFPTKAAESAAASGQQQLSKLMSNNISPQLKTHQNHLFPFWDPINNLNSTSIFSRQIVHPQYYSSLGHDQPHVSRIFAPDNYINMTGEYDQAKLGTFSSFNNSIISTHDLVKVCDDQALPSCPSMPDLDSLWN